MNTSKYDHIITDDTIVMIEKKNRYIDLNELPFFIL